MEKVDLLTHLKSRRTVPSVNLGLPGPSEAEIEEMLTIAARVPDHGKLAPWRFIRYPNNKADEIGTALAKRLRDADPDAPEMKLAQAEQAFKRAPVVIGVVSTAAPHVKIPEWEQVLSAGAVCLNMVHAAYAFGYRAQWLTEWFTFDDEAAAFLGAGEGEKFAGFIHIGTPDIAPTERDRPDVVAKTSVWGE